MTRPLPRSRWTPRWLDGLSALLLLVALAATAWRRTPTVTPRVVRVPATPAAGAARATDADSLAGRIVATNLFSATRRAPRERFVVPGQGAMDVPTAELLPVAGPPSATDDDVRVVGIVSVNGVRRALMAAGVGDSTTRLVAVGDRVAGYRVRRIGAEVVELSSSSGTRTVRLSRRSSSDSSESLP